MIQPYLITAQAARAHATDYWRIEHTATHLSIEILLPDTDPPAVKWILPDGSTVEGAVLDADVPAGETKCVCGDFTRCGIDMSGCDPYAVRINCAEMPVIRPRLRNMRGRCGYYRDMRYNTPVYVLASDGNQKAMGAGMVRITGSKMVLTVDDINRRKSGGRKGTHVHLEIGYVPNFTGDLAKLNIETQHWYRILNNDFTGYVDLPDDNDDMVDIMQHTIVHHTGAHGHCDLSRVEPGHFGFHGNPNMTPDDYDQTCITLAACMQSMKDSNTLSLFLFDPDDFILDISTRRTSASDEAVATLRALGMTVNEIED